MPTNGFSLCIFVLCVAGAHGAKILGIFAYPSPSHAILGSALLKELANRGHQVTMISSSPLEKPHKNYEDVVLTGPVKYKDEEMRKFRSPNSSFISRVLDVSTIRTLYQNRILGDSNLQQFLKSKPKFDAAIVMTLASESLLGIAHEVGAVPINFCVTGANSYVNYHLGNPSPFSYVPLIFYPYTDDMTFFQRLKNTLATLVFDFYIYAINFRVQKEIYAATFPNAPPLEEFIDQIPLTLVNSHFSTEAPKPYLPEMIQIGGFHLQEKENLPSDLAAYFDSVKKGVILFSLGTNLIYDDLSADKLKIFIETFRELDYDILWKLDKPIPNLPDNVKIVNWMPQRAVLQHPKTLAFITHSGFGSTVEATYAGVPMLCLPFFADQIKNSADTVKQGFGLEVDINTMTKESFSKSLVEILRNDTYRKNIQFKSDLMSNQEMNPMDKAVYWVEHAVKYKGSLVLKSRASTLRWYQYYLLDVIGFVALVLSILSFCCIYVFKKFIACLCKRNNKEKMS